MITYLFSITKNIDLYKTHFLQTVAFHFEFPILHIELLFQKKKNSKKPFPPNKTLLIGFVSFLQEVVLPKDQGSLGFSIIGGTDHSCVPFGANEPGIFISHVKRN